METLEDYLENCKLFKRVTLFMDIETLMYNKQQGKLFPSRYKNMTFAVGVSWIVAGKVNTQVFPNFKEIFDLIIKTFKNQSKKPTIEINMHNGNKYDNHFLRKDLLYFYPGMQVENYWLTTATTEKSNEDSTRLKDLTAKEKKGIILEKRIKSKINLEMIFFIQGIQFETVDNWVKTNSSIDLLGKKLKRLGKITADELKTDFNYTKYDKDHDLTTEQARAYVYEVFQGLSKEERTYIENDVIILALSAYYYADLFNGFDYSKMTFTSNILDSYNTNDLTSFQLLNRIGQGKDRLSVRYTDYFFSNQNFYDYLKNFYRGGLNFYNYHYIGEIITDGVFGMDINSSYPYAMHNFKIPTYLKDFEEYEKPTPVSVEIDDPDEYALYEITKEVFDFLILDQVDSLIVKQMLVKYYSTNEHMNLNTYTFKMLADIMGIHFETIPVLSKVVFETAYFGSREQIEEFYKLKTQGDYETKIHFINPYEIEVTDEYNEEKLSPEEYDNSKVNLNGLYGIPALRPYFNLFRRDENGEYYNIENGHKNAERNIVFSIFVTSVSLWNLLTPFKYLTGMEIDNNFLYADTDSLYMKKAIQHKIPESIFSPNSLGKWDLDYNNIKNFYVLNHKKYAYTDDEGNIKVRAGGIPNDSFKTDTDFKTFIDTQFSPGVEIDSLKSIYNAGETISIYPSKTKLELGHYYRIHANDEEYNELKQQIFKEVKENIDEFSDDVLYIESVIGTFSVADVFQVEHETKDKRPLVYLEITHEKIKDMIH